MKVINTLSNIIQWIGERALVAIASILVIITFYGVFMRKVFNDPPTWQYEFSIVLFSWLTFVGAALAFKRQEHIKLDFVENRLQGNTKKAFEIAIQIIVGIFLVIGIFGGSQVVRQTMAQSYTTIPVPVATFYGAFLACVIMSLVFVIEKICLLLKQKPEEFKRVV